MVSPSGETWFEGQKMVSPCGETGSEGQKMVSPGGETFFDTMFNDNIHTA
jgi:hypothetical protein